MRLKYKKYPLKKAAPHARLRTAQPFGLSPHCAELWHNPIKPRLFKSASAYAFMPAASVFTPIQMICNRYIPILSDSFHVFRQ